MMCASTVPVAALPGVVVSNTGTNRLSSRRDRSAKRRTFSAFAERSLHLILMTEIWAVNHSHTPVMLVASESLLISRNICSIMQMNRGERCEQEHPTYRCQCVLRIGGTTAPSRVERKADCGMWLTRRAARYCAHSKLSGKTPRRENRHGNLAGTTAVPGVDHCPPRYAGVYEDQQTCSRYL